jgi:hypothetical protein
MTGCVGSQKVRSIGSVHHETHRGTPAPVNEGVNMNSNPMNGDKIETVQPDLDVTGHTMPVEDDDDVEGHRAIL